MVRVASQGLNYHDWGFAAWPLQAAVEKHPKLGVRAVVAAVGRVKATEAQHFPLGEAEMAGGGRRGDMGSG